MKLSLKLPVWEQIQSAIDAGVPLIMDLREEALGDKVAALGIAQWVAERVGVKVTIIESTKRTPFLLSKLPVLYESVDATTEEIEGLDIHTTGIHESLWVLNGYLATLEQSTFIPNPYQESAVHKFPKKRLDNIVFAFLSDADYNERRNMNAECTRQTVDALRSAGHTVTILTAKPNKLLHDAHQFPIDECLERIASAKLFIGGDTGFSHYAAAVGTPQIGLYPDWQAHGVSKLSDAQIVAEWWQIPAYNISRCFLPNAPFSKLRIVEMGNHRWSIEAVLQAVRNLRQPK